LDHKLISKVIN